jgi:F-type H+-transporting ATPase subunit delta
MSTDRSQTRKASLVYAETLLEAAQAEGTVFAVTGQLASALEALHASVQLRETLTDRFLPVSGRQELIREIFADFSPALLAVLGVMVEREDLGLLHRINEAYVQVAEEALGATIIEVTTAIALDEDLRTAICAKYSTQFGTEVLLREHLDPAILGGIILNAHGKRIDASVLFQLEQARVTLSNSR